MSYTDQKSLINNFSKQVKHQSDASIKDFFLGFLGNRMAKTKYGSLKIVNDIFYVGDSHSSGSKFQLADHEFPEYGISDTTTEVEIDDDGSTIALLNDYLQKLDYRREENRMRMFALYAIFLMRDFRFKYYLLKTGSDKYNKVFINIYQKLMSVKFNLLEELTETLMDCVIGDKPYVSKISKLDSDKLIEAYSVIRDLDQDAMLDDMEEPEFDLDYSDLTEAIKDLNFKLLSYRTNRLITKKNFPFLNSKKLALANKIVAEYRSVYIRFYPNANIQTICKLVGISQFTYDKYKKIVASELIALSQKSNYNDITLYLLEND